MEFLSWLKKVFAPQPAAMGRSSDSSQSWSLSSSRDGGSDVFNDSYFNDPGGGESGSTDSGSDGGSGGDGGGGSD